MKAIQAFNERTKHTMTIRGLIDASERYWTLFWAHNGLEDELDDTDDVLVDSDLTDNIRGLSLTMPDGERS